MKVYSAHFILTGDSSYKDLAPVFEEILEVLLESIAQIPEEEEIMEMYLEQNLRDLENDRKPEGYNRKGKVRLIFPMDRKEFYLKSYSKNTDLTAIAEAVSEILDSEKISYETVTDDRITFE